MDILESAVLFATDPGKMLVVVVSVLLAITALLAWKKYNSPSLLYAHLFFVISPLFYFALSINCGMGFSQSLLSFCTALFTKFVIFILPPVMILSFIVGYAVMPKLYARKSKPAALKLFDKLTENTGIGAKLRVVDKAAPVAFTLGGTVFVSVGLFEQLSKKELEAVLLHELYHVKSNSSWSKFSVSFVRVFSPIAWFSSSSVEREEIAADKFAIKVQGTSRFINSAKLKV